MRDWRTVRDQIETILLNAVCTLICLAGLSLYLYLLGTPVGSMPDYVMSIATFILGYVNYIFIDLKRGSK